MRLSEIHNTIPIIESMRTDFYDMYLLSSVQHNDDPDVEALLTDRVDKLNLYRAKQERGDVSRPSPSPHWFPDDDDDDADN